MNTSSLGRALARLVPLAALTAALTGCCFGGQFYIFHVTVTDAATGEPVAGVKFAHDGGRALCEGDASPCAVWQVEWNGGAITVSAPGYAPAALDVSSLAADDVCGGGDLPRSVTLVATP